MANPGNDFTRCLLIAGLGNPGEEYSGTRHNMGFMVVDRLLAKLPKNFEAVHGCSSRYWRGTYAGRALLLQKPETYMNLSGDAISALMRREGIEPGEIAVVYDDMDLELGRIRIRKNGSSGGHNGIKSIIGRLGTEAFPRIRIVTWRAYFVRNTLSSAAANPPPITKTSLPVKNSPSQVAQ